MQPPLSAVGRKQYGFWKWTNGIESEIVELPGKQEEELNLLIYFKEWQAYRYIFLKNILTLI